MKILINYLRIFIFFLLSCGGNTKPNQNPCDILVAFHSGIKYSGSYCLDCTNRKLVSNIHSSIKGNTDTVEISFTLCDTLMELIDSIIVKNNYRLVIDSVVGTDPTNFSILFKQKDSLKTIEFNSNMGVEEMLRRMNPPALHLKELLEKRIKMETCN